MKLSNMSETLLFIGDLIQESSEIDFLSQLGEDLIKRDKRALIFANFLAGRRRQQIDFLVITSNCACVVELKNYNTPVFGQVNGPWELRRPDGTLIRRLGNRNPYRQALQAKYSINEEMHRLLHDHPGLLKPPENKQYISTIESVLCIFPEIPPGSRVTPGDYKAYVKGYPDFLEFLLTTGTSPGWMKDDWLFMATKLGLRQQDISEAAHPDQRTATKQSETYLKRFLDFYGRNLPELVPTEMRIDDKPCTPEALLSLLGVENSLQITGPSGCGKTHLIKHLAISSIPKGRAPVFAPAKYFSGRLSNLLDRSVAPLYPDKAMQLLKTLSAAGLQQFLIIDGINECPGKELPVLIETLQAFALRRKCPIVITGRNVIKLPLELKGPTLGLSYLADSEKQEVLGAYVQQPGANIKELLGALKTPLEITLAAQVTTELPSLTKYELFNSYTRKCLERDGESSLAFRTLVKVAQIMADRLSTALPQSEFNRVSESFAESVHAQPDVLKNIQESGLVQIEQGYFTFSHEMIQRFFETEALLSLHASTAERAREMEKPRNYHLADFMLGAQADTETARTLLRSLAFHNLLLEGIKGHFGRHVESALLSDLSELFQKAHEELQKLDLLLKVEQELPELIVQPVTGVSWTPYEIALMDAIGRGFPEGLFLDEVLELLRRSERKCFKVLESKEIPEKQRGAVRNGLFRSLYVVMSGELLPISHILQAIRSATWGRRFQKLPPETESSLKTLFRDLEDQPLGVLLLLCQLIRYWKTSFVVELPRLLRLCWQTGIYNLRLEALYAVQDTEHQVKRSLRARLIHLVKSLDWEGNLGLSTTIFEVLARYNAFDAGISVENAIEQVSRVLDARVDTKSCEEAYGLFSMAFEDIFRGVYDEAIWQLDSEDRVKFLTMAALGAPEYSFDIDLILQMLLESNDPRAIPAFEKWSSVPDPESVSVQGTVKAFILALVGLARHTEAPPRLRRPLRDDEAAWQAYGEILFWLHKPSITEDTMRKNCAAFWQRLLRGFIHAAVDPLMHIGEQTRGWRGTDQEWLRDPILTFPTEVRAVLEGGLKAKEKLTSLFTRYTWLEKKRDKFIIEMLGEVGDETTITLLEPLLESPELGILAVNAIRSIRTREAG
ncbi:MAG: NERD domain-containing protein [Candidatus Hodarchaeota archaeon]